MGGKMSELLVSTKLSERVRRKIRKNRENDRETYDDVVTRIIKFYEENK